MSIHQREKFKDQIIELDAKGYSCARIGGKLKLNVREASIMRWLDSWLGVSQFTIWEWLRMDAR